MQWLRTQQKRKVQAAPPISNRINLFATTLCQVGLAHSAKAVKDF